MVAVLLVFVLSADASTAWSPPYTFSNSGEDPAQMDAVINPADGKYHIAWVDGTNLSYSYAVCNPSNNTCEREPSVAGASAASGTSDEFLTADAIRPGIGMDTLGNVYVGYSNNKNNNVVVKKKSSNGSTFLPFKTLGVGWQVRVAVDKSNFVHVVWGASSALYYERFSSSGIVIVNQLTLTTNGQAAAIATDTAGNAHIVFQTSSSPHNIMYSEVTAAGSAVGPTSVFGNGSNSIDPAIGIDTTNKLHFAWRNAAGSLPVQYKKCDAGLTNCSAVKSMPDSNIGNQPSIATVGNVAFVAYYRQTPANDLFLTIWRTDNNTLDTSADTRTKVRWPVIRGNPVSGELNVVYRLVANSSTTLLYRHQPSNVVIGTSTATRTPTLINNFTNTPAATATTTGTPQHTNTPTDIPTHTLTPTATNTVVVTGRGPWSTPASIAASTSALISDAAVDSSGTVHVAWIFGNTLKYSYASCSPVTNSCPDSGTIDVATISGNVNSSTTNPIYQKPSVAVKPNGEVYVGYADPASDTSPVAKFVKKTGATTFGSPVTLGSGWQVRLAADSANNLHAVYGKGGTLAYKKYDSSDAIVSAATHSDISGANALAPAIATDSNNNAHIVWYTLISQHEIIYREVKADGAYGNPLQNVSNNSTQSINPTIAVDSSNQLHIAWEDGPIPHKVLYMRCSPAFTDPSTQCTGKVNKAGTDDAYDPSITTIGTNYFIAYHRIATISGNPHHVAVVYYSTDNSRAAVDGSFDEWFPVLRASATGELNLIYRLVSGGTTNLQYRHQSSGVTP